MYILYIACNTPVRDVFGQTRTGKSIQIPPILVKRTDRSSLSDPTSKSSSRGRVLAERTRIMLSDED